METCEDIIDRISEIIDGEADAVPTVKFYAHLAMCKNCRRYYQQMVVVRDATGHVDPAEVPDDFREIMGFVLDGMEPSDDE